MEEPEREGGAFCAASSVVASSAPPGATTFRLPQRLGGTLGKTTLKAWERMLQVVETERNHKCSALLAH
ncbi:hypothetical protein U9M48_001941 [Paspalum notatum var. saurae]|uniref:Uncharacterized protein n=1 Tax=Paspalum notatum var. saurae TaxID=547442 RepID=A0AAQ3PK62_PASNO